MDLITTLKLSRDPKTGEPIVSRAEANRVLKLAGNGLQIIHATNGDFLGRLTGMNRGKGEFQIFGRIVDSPEPYCLPELREAVS